ncbi:MAG: DUF2027 domain-containing protein, partial [Prevotellaceae bacterium]|nr:DUF2027 domain-containing protein [Prevotellaceae bacterium]
MKIGDKVRFLNDTGGGTVLRIEGKTAIISDNNGFEIPTPVANVVVVNVRETTNFPIGSTEAGSFSAGQDGCNTNVPADAPAARQANATLEKRVGDGDAVPPERDASGESYELMLAFLPPVNNKTELYLLNDSPYRLLYSIGMYERDGNVQPLAQGQMEGDSKQLVKKLYVSQLREVRTLHVEVVLYKNVRYKPQNLNAIDVELSPIRFFRKGAFTENDFFDENALIIALLSSTTVEKEKMRNVSAEEIREAMLQKNDVPPKPLQTIQQPELEEVDLHAEMLVEDVRKLS